MKILLCSFFSALLLLCVQSVSAEDNPPKPNDLFGPDQNRPGDAAPAPAEKRRRMAQRQGDRPTGDRPQPSEEDLQKLFDALDADQNGSISAEEFKALPLAQQTLVEAKRAAMEEDMLQKYDVNGNGTLDEEEKQALMEDRRKEMQQKQLERLKEENPEKYAELDTNSDGIIDEAEKQAIQDKMHERMQKHIENNPELKAKIDRNGDGTIDEQEMEAARKMMRQRQQRGGGDDARKNRSGDKPHKRKKD